MVPPLSRCRGAILQLFCKKDRRRPHPFALRTSAYLSYSMRSRQKASFTTKIHALRIWKNQHVRASRRTTKFSRTRAVSCQTWDTSPVSSGVVGHLAGQLRRDLLHAGVTRPELSEARGTWARFNVHTLLHQM